MQTLAKGTKEGGPNNQNDDEEPQPGVREWLTLILIMLIATGYQVQKYTLAFAYGYQASELDLDRHNNPLFEITSYYPNLATYYPYLSGFAVLLPQTICTLFTGIVADKYNRVNILGIASISWSLCTLLAGETDNFGIFVASRVIMGAFFSFIHPPSTGIIRDNFGPSFRATANSVYLFAGFLGGGLASLSIQIIERYGWRAAYDAIAISGILLGILCLTLVQEPERGRLDKQVGEQQ